MRGLLTNYQKQELGTALNEAAYSPMDFVYSETHETETDYGFATLINRETSDKIDIYVLPDSRYTVNRTTPGTVRNIRNSSVSWTEVTELLTRWAKDVRRESEAIDPWQEEAEEMANDDSYFTVTELPRVDNAIDNSLEELKQRAVEHGKDLKEIKESLDEASRVLKNAARNSTKKEWLAIFKGIVIEKLVDWGLQAELFQHVLQTLISSAHDVARLTDYASRHLLL